jgi:N,N'-diacetyllegionaminate synthase
MVDGVLLGKDHLVIAEVAQAHDGNLSVVHQLVDAVARAGAHAVKFQTHIADEESTEREPWRIKFSSRDSSRKDYWRRMEFSVAQWKEIKSHCVSVGVEFMSSPFSPAAVDLLQEVGVRVWKIASGEISNSQLLGCVSASGLPVILSSGLSTLAELEVAVQEVGRSASHLAILQCATQYPTPAREVGLNVIGQIRSRFDCVVGISDHSATPYPSFAAAALGAQVFETHIRLDDDHVGPDASSSLVESQLAELVRGVAFIRDSLASPVDKNVLSEQQVHLRTVFGRSLVVSRDLSAGDLVTESNLAFKKPGGGLGYRAIKDVVGRRLRRSLKKDEEIHLDDLEEPR